MRRITIVLVAGALLAGCATSQPTYPPGHPLWTSPPLRCTNCDTSNLYRPDVRDWRTWDWNNMGRGATSTTCVGGGTSWFFWITC